MLDRGHNINLTWWAEAQFYVAEVPNRSLNEAHLLVLLYAHEIAGVHDSAISCERHDN